MATGTNTTTTVGRRILGIDPGSNKTGYAALLQVGRQLSVLESGTICLSSRWTLSRRLGALAEQIDELVARIAPQEVAVEDVFSSKNARSALALGQARGAILAAVGRRAVPVEAYPPATIKKAITGHGAADKVQIQRMVSAMLALTQAPQADEADAMAVAICHALARRAAR
ncbi:MAG: crossover junction endodeoxyribonuclease RuvC [Deltaproteobacteria bacterium]|nr:crossover junction endodeoxyribonuclease RuvC [Deltaproteobacteria bacterium]